MSLTAMAQRRSRGGPSEPKRLKSDTHKKSLQIPLACGKLGFGFYVMVTVPTVQLGRVQQPTAEGAPLTAYHLLFTRFLIARLAIRNRRKFFPFITKSISNRPKKALFQITLNRAPGNLRRSLLIDSRRIKIDPNSYSLNKRAISNRQ